MAFNLANFFPFTPVNVGAPQQYRYNCGSDSFATCASAGYFNALLTINQGINTGDKILVQSGAPTLGLSFSGTFRNNNSSIAIDWDRTLYFQSHLANISTAAGTWFIVPPAGVIIETFATQEAAITVSSTVLTFSIGATAITDGAITVVTAGTAGSAYSSIPTALNLTDGVTAVTVASAGSSTGAAGCATGFKIICPTQI
jgi:hypothetical protein